MFTPIQYSPAFQVKENKEKERLERRLFEELYKIFMDSDSFYYSLTYDLTNTVQRQGALGMSDQPLWKKVRVFVLYILKVKCLLNECYSFVVYKSINVAISHLITSTPSLKKMTKD